MDLKLENILANLVRIGTVSTVDLENKKARVIFKDKDNLVSGWLYVIQRDGAYVNVESGGTHEHTVAGSGSTSVDGAHDHTANVTSWMPEVNDTVLTVYLPVFNADGFILGAI